MLGVQKRKRKRARRVTMPSKRSKTNRLQRMDTEINIEIDVRPSAKEYATWTSYRSFVVNDQNDDPVTFCLGGYGLVVPAGVSAWDPLHLNKYWVGRIRQIRSRGNDPSEVWAKVQWLWSANDVAEATQTMDIKPFGMMERFRSDSFDFVHSSCFQYIANVVQFDESDVEPPNIVEETFYVRYSYDYMKKRIHPKVIATCLCGVPYNPDTSSAMHFCPRKKCNVAFHASCLRENGWVYNPEYLASPPNNDHQTQKTPEMPGKRKRQRTQTSESESGQAGGGGGGGGGGGKVGKTPVPRGLQFERTLPGSSVRDSLKSVPPDCVIDVDSSPSSAINVSISQTPPARKRARVTFTRYKLIPPALLALARSPMVRGNETGLPEERGCVAGNVAFVMRARGLVARIVHEGEELPEDWVAMLGLPQWEAETDSEGDVEENGGKEEVMEWAVKDEGLLCPSCGGAI